MYTAVKEIGHMLTIEHLDTDVEGKSGKSAAKVVAMIVIMNLIFSFDSVLSALAITDVFPILATAIILSGLAMLLLADGVTRFLEQNRMYEVLGLFILLIVGVVLLGEAGQAAAHAMHDDGPRAESLRLRSHSNVENHILLLCAGSGRGRNHPVRLHTQAERRTSYRRSSLSKKKQQAGECICLFPPFALVFLRAQAHS